MMLVFFTFNLFFYFQIDPPRKKPLSKIPALLRLRAFVKLIFKLCNKNYLNSEQQLFWEGAGGQKIGLHNSVLGLPSLVSLPLCYKDE